MLFWGQMSDIVPQIHFGATLNGDFFRYGTPKCVFLTDFASYTSIFFYSFLANLFPWSTNVCHPFLESTNVINSFKMQKYDDVMREKNSYAGEDDIWVRRLNDLNDYLSIQNDWKPCVTKTLLQHLWVNKRQENIFNEWFLVKIHELHIDISSKAYNTQSCLSTQPRYKAYANHV